MRECLFHFGNAYRVRRLRSAAATGEYGDREEKSSKLHRSDVTTRSRGTTLACPSAPECPLNPRCAAGIMSVVTRKVLMLGVAGFVLWIAVVVTLAVVGVVVGLHSSTAQVAGEAGSFVAGVLIVVGSWKTRLRRMRVPIGLSGPFLGVVTSAALGPGKTIGLVWLGLSLGLFAPPLVWYLVQMGRGAASRREAGAMR